LAFSRSIPRRTRTASIVIHHLAANVPVQTVHRWHLGNGWAGIAYQFQIDQDGTIWAGRDVDAVGGHTLGHNSDTVGIACQGNFHTVDRHMSDPQFNALIWLIRHLHTRYGNLPIRAHRELTATACPGQHFPLEEVRRLQFRGEEAEEMTEAQVRAIVSEMLRGNDTTPSAWAEGEFTAAVALGITDGTRPGGRLTREEGAIMALRALKKAGGRDAL